MNSVRHERRIKLSNTAPSPAHIDAVRANRTAASRLLCRRRQCSEDPTVEYSTSDHCCVRSAQVVLLLFVILLVSPSPCPHSSLGGSGRACPCMRILHAKGSCTSFHTRYTDALRTRSRHVVSTETWADIHTYPSTLDLPWYHHGIAGETINFFCFSAATFIFFCFCAIVLFLLKFFV